MAENYLLKIKTKKMTNELTVKCVKQPNMFDDGKFKYYIVFRKGAEQHVINVGETTYEKVLSLTIDTINKNAEKEAAKTK
nr:MAG: hypothetical protein [Microviridae sp.]